MTIAFFTNFISHHQVLVADELYSLTNGGYHFVQMIPMPESFNKNGYPDLSSRPYVVHAWKDPASRHYAEQLAVSVDVMLIGGSESLPFEVLRCRKTNKLTLELSERWFKRGLVNIFSPRLLKWLWYYYTLFSRKEVYKLCCSAYTSKDMLRLHAMKNRCFKWGYFTKVDSDFEVEATGQGASTSEITPLMWCARFLKLKHPELPVRLAARLKEKGYKFTIDMFGSGEELDNTKKHIDALRVNDCVRLCGNRPNEEILKEMRRHKIFLFTSDRHEGWGAVLNEAMANGCVPVATDEIGSSRYLIKDGINGFIFKSCDLDSLTEKVEWLLNHPQERKKMSIIGYQTIRDVWSPQNAANNLMRLIEDLMKNRKTSIEDGPCSIAEII